MTVDLAALAAPTPANEIKQREGPRGMKLDYVDARWVMERLDASVGPENWQDKYEEHQGGSVRCSIGIRIAPPVTDHGDGTYSLASAGEDWVWKSDVGDPSDIESTKGAHSDAFKRAAVKWGVARDLYGDHARPQNGPRRATTAPDAPQRESVTIGAPRPVLVAVGAPAGEPEIAPEEWDRLITPWEVMTQAKRGGPEDGCTVHDKPWKLVPAGTSKKSGKPYAAFLACPEFGCQEKPR